MNKLDQIAGNEHIKRAIEVALAGNHPIAIIHHKNSLAHELLNCLSQIAAENTGKMGIKALYVPICECHGFGTPQHECECNVEDLIASFATKREWIKDFPIVIKCYECDPYDYTNMMKNESEEDILKRVVNCIDSDIVVSSELSQDSLELIKIAKNSHPNLNDDFIISVAKTIAKLEGKYSIELPHLSEAIMYQHNLVFQEFKQ